MGAGGAAAAISPGDVSDDDSLASPRGDEPSTSSAGLDEDSFPAFPFQNAGWVPPTGPTHTHYKSSSTKLGGGAFGEVLAGRRLADGTAVALKRIPIRVIEDGIPDNLLRELKTMQRVAGRSPHVLNLIDHYCKGNALVLVLELCEYGDLRDLLDVQENAGGLSIGCVKSVVQQILSGVKACHDLNVMHRDVKPGNVLVAHDGRMKLADFGLARAVTNTYVGDTNRQDEGNFSSHSSSSSHSSQLTGNVQTRWYRAPEILFGSKSYSMAIDVWSVGAILGELLSPCGPILQGESDVDQLSRTLGMLGTPSETRWPDAQNTPDFHKIKFHPKRPMDLETALPKNTDPGLGTDLWMRLMQLDPKKRPIANEALQDPYFNQTPHPATPWEAFCELRLRRAKKITPAVDKRASDMRDMPPGVRALTDTELRDALTELGLEGEIAAI